MGTEALPLPTGPASAEAALGGSGQPHPQEAQLAAWSPRTSITA